MSGRMDEASFPRVAKVIDEVAKGLRQKIDSKQGGIPTYFDNLLLKWIAEIRETASQRRGPKDFDAKLCCILHVFTTLQSPRFVPYYHRISERRVNYRLPWECESTVRSAFQGMRECMSWKGMPLFKSIVDFAIYPMLVTQLRPLTIFELGSGNGSSALWLAELMSSNGVEGTIVSIDRCKPDVVAPRVHFIQWDCKDLAEICHQEKFARLPHPWFIIDDVRVDVAGTISVFGPLLCEGDYLVVEDSDSVSHRSTFAKMTRELLMYRLLVDTYFTDFFGRNSTSSVNSIFSKQPSC